MNLPLTWRYAAHVFVSPGSDIFATNDESYIVDAFAVMNAASQHEFQLTTRRFEVIHALTPRLQFTANIWLGGIIGAESEFDVLDKIRASQAKVKFAHFNTRAEVPTVPDLRGIDFVVVETDRELELLSLKSACDTARARLFVGRRAESAELVPAQSNRNTETVR